MDQIFNSSQSCFFSKKVYNILYLKIFRLFQFWSFHKMSSNSVGGGGRNDQDKISSSFWDITEKDVFSDI